MRRWLRVFACWLFTGHSIRFACARWTYTRRGKRRYSRRWGECSCRAVKVRG